MIPISPRSGRLMNPRGSDRWNALACSPLPMAAQPLSTVAESWSAWASVASDLAGILAMVVAAVWTYNLFWKRRQTKPRAHLEQEVSIHRLPAGQLLVHIELRVRNIGEVLLQIRELRTRILQVLPLTPDLQAGLDAGFELTMKGETELRWPRVKDWPQVLDPEKHPCDVEPGETEEFHFDAIVDPDITRLQVHSHVSNVDVRGHGIGWRRTSHHDAPAWVEETNSPIVLKGSTP